MADADSLLLEDTPDLTPDPTQADQLEHEAAAAENPVEDPELEAIKQRVREMEEEAEKLKEMQNEVERQMNLSPTAQRPGATAGVAFPSIEDKMEADGRSVYVGNVDYGATAEELEAHFHGCGSINRVTILCDKFTGHPKGFAYIEFADKDSIETAKALDDSLFRGRQIKVVPKRTNRPGVSTTDRPPRGRGGYRGRGGGFRGFNSGYGGYGGYYPRRSRGFRSRRAAWYSPY
ncbi:polyadenylate-binding protein 2-B-like isoform X2 [Branchiostoma floridae]|uniref:Polyadenylate-binding protein 2-B-like isoform X2 n=1 Tax=Branchiostoma floridae TaxID=7739 RepID=A0A9J7LDG6_BRAFL|nr:polyadenylate-binding protein 2-B-like isoform X2 [Branchiostoma floridae]